MEVSEIERIRVDNLQNDTESLKLFQYLIKRFIQNLSEHLHYQKHDEGVCLLYRRSP